MAKRKTMSTDISEPDFENISLAAGSAKPSIEELENTKESAIKWNRSQEYKAVDLVQEQISESKAPKQKSRIGRVPIQGYFEELTRDRLKFLALRDKTTVESLMSEAFQDYFEKHKDKFKGIPHLEG